MCTMDLCTEPRCPCVKNCESCVKGFGIRVWWDSKSRRKAKWDSKSRVQHGGAATQQKEATVYKTGVHVGPVLPPGCAKQSHPPW